MLFRLLEHTVCGLNILTDPTASRMRPQYPLRNSYPPILQSSQNFYTYVEFQNQQRSQSIHLNSKAEASEWHHLYTWDWHEEFRYSGLGSISHSAIYCTLIKGGLACSFGLTKTLVHFINRSTKQFWNLDHWSQVLIFVSPASKRSL